MVGVRLSFPGLEGRADPWCTEASVIVVDTDLRPRALASTTHHAQLRVAALRDAGGAQNVPYLYRLTADSVCAVHAVLDDDKEGRSARTKLDLAGVLPSDITMLSAVGMTESELEDLFDDKVFADHLKTHFNVTCDTSVTQENKRFSLRMKDNFANSGQTWSDSVASKLKAELAGLLTDDTKDFQPRADRLTVINALAEELTTKLTGSPPAIEL